ncbi:MAG: hypothetical protein NTU94_10700, partial [Planctomycetota bacterium]|nr:hypothetical protein [Planctomycetota bacterium]
MGFATRLRARPLRGPRFNADSLADVPQDVPQATPDVAQDAEPAQDAPGTTRTIVLDSLLDTSAETVDPRA